MQSSLCVVKHYDYNDYKGSERKNIYFKVFYLEIEDFNVNLRKLCSNEIIEKLKRLNITATA